MKKISIYYVFLLTLLGVGGCDEDMTKVTLNEDLRISGFSGLSEEGYTLLHEQGEDVFDSLQWTAPDYGFTTYATYTVQMDVAGYDFANAIDLITTDALTATLTNNDVNTALLDLGLTPRAAATVEFRVVATINDHVDPAYSEVQQAVITPHSGSIYVIGDAQSWSLDQATALEFTSSGVYQGKADLVQGGKFRLFSYAEWEAGQWGWSYFQAGSTASGLEDGGDADSNFLFTGETGQYRITVSLEEPSISLELANDPVLYLIGAPQGWSLNNDLQMKTIEEGEFEIVATLEDGNYFRFFEALSWDAVQYRYSDFTDGTIDETLTFSADDADANFIFTGTDGIYKISVSLNDQLITVEPAEEPTLYIIGADQGWDLNNAFAMTWLGGGKFEGTTGFTQDAIFRFFETADWAAAQYNYNDFLEGSMDTGYLSGSTEGDANLTFIGTSGTYTITVNTNALEVRISE